MNFFSLDLMCADIWFDSYMVFMPIIVFILIVKFCQFQRTFS